MAINFDELPQDKPQGFEVLPEGTYLAVVKEASMKSGKSGNGDYMQVVLKITADDGKTILVFDNFFDSDKPLPRYKLGQFMRALKINMHGNFELVDLTKVITNKSCMVALKSEQNEGYAARNVVNAFDDEIYSPANALDANVPETSATDTPFPPAEGDAQY